MGYDIHRFLKGSVKEEFSCIICQDVLKEPKMIDKCEHIFCSTCILEWISCKGICPVDRQTISVQQLREPIRSFRSLLGQLEISCDFATFGCNEYVKLDDLERHVANCSYNRDDLIQVECLCGQSITKNELETHQQNCVTYVRREIERTKTSINTLKKSLAQTNIRAKKTVFEEWNECNRQYVVVKCEMKANVKTEAIKLITDGLNAGNNDFMSKIVDLFIKKYNGVWFGFTEIIEFDKLNSYCYAKESLLQLKVKSYHINLFKIFRAPMAETIEVTRRQPRPSISNKTMKDSMVEVAIALSN